MADRALVPQRPTHGRGQVVGSDWLFEPGWTGERLLARLRAGRVTVSDASGTPVEDRLDDAARILEGGIAADEAVLDGVWSTDFLFADATAPAGLPAFGPERGSAVLGRPSEPAFVAVDLLELDGQSLLDVPLLERRRLLGAVVVEGLRLRISPAVRNPVHSWLIAWRENGFGTYIAKHENSRYLPGEANPDWVRLSSRPVRPTGMMGRLLGARDIGEREVRRPRGR